MFGTLFDDWVEISARGRGAMSAAQIFPLTSRGMSSAM
jgi:hypothetical protein